MLTNPRKPIQKISIFLIFILSLLLFYEKSSKKIETCRAPPPPHSSGAPQNDIENKIPPLPVLELGPGLSSTDGLYMRHPHVWPRMRPDGQDNVRVCLATQTSVDRISSLLWILKTWSGPVSVAVFTPGTHYQIFSVMVRYLAECFPELSKLLSFQVLYPKSRKPIFSHNSSFVQYLSCHDPQATLSRIYTEMSAINNNSFIKHPQNHLRNLAHQTCDTSFSLLIDIDLVPSFRMFERLNTFLEGVDCHKCAFVVPAYEIHKSQESIPANKIALLQLIWNERTAQPFYKEIFPQAHATSYPDLWERDISNKEEDPLFFHIEKSSSTGLNTSLSVTDILKKDVPYEEMFSIHRSKYTFFWEPFVVLPSHASAWDERFVGFGCVRNTQIYELFLQQYRFSVLDEAFVIHVGYKYSDEISETRQKDVEMNCKNLDAFRMEMTLRYSESSKQTTNTNGTKCRTGSSIPQYCLSFFI